MLRFLLATALLSIALIRSDLADAKPQQTASDAQGARMTAVFEAWARKNKIRNASFAVMRGNDVIGEASVGKYNSQKATPIAMLSMSITAVCIIKLVEDGRLNYTDTIGTLLPAYFAARPHLASAREYTILDLINHKTYAGSPFGFDSRDKFEDLDFGKTNLEAFFTLGLQSPYHGAPPTASQSEIPFRINFVNYAGLGLVIEAITGKSYRKACNELILEPAGITTATYDPDWKIMSSWGGWNLSAVDYARFLNYFRPGSGLLKTPASDWPKEDFGCCVQPLQTYSLGMEMRPSVKGKYNLQLLSTWEWTNWHKPETNTKYTALFRMFNQNLRYVVTLTSDLSTREYSKLVVGLYQAAYPSSERRSVR